MLGFLLLAIFALSQLPIEQKVRVQGTVTQENHRKSIQSAASSIIKSVFVEEGQHVQEGELLLKLFDEKQAADLKQIEDKLVNLYLTRDRLKSEVEELSEIYYSQDLEEFPNATVSLLKIKEDQIFQNRQNSWKAYKISISHQIKQLETQITSFEKQSFAKNDQLLLIKEEVSDLEKLYEDGLVPKSRYFALQRRLSEIEEQITVMDLRAIRNKDRILELKAQYSKQQSDRTEGIFKNLRDTDEKISNTLNQLKVSQKQNNETEIRAASDGVVFNMKALHKNYVVKSAETLMQIVPDEERLVIDCLIPDHLISKLEQKMQAKIIPQTSNTFFEYPMNGEIERISNDALSRENQENNHYIVRLRLENDQNRLISGMSVDLHLITGKISILEYVLLPIKNRFLL